MSDAVSGDAREASSSVPIGLRVYASCSQGGRKYMEDNYDLKYQFNQDNQLQFIYLAIFDGHGGDVAAKFAKEHLCRNITRQRAFWSDNDQSVLMAISKGFVRTHYDMRKHVLDWPKTASGLPSTSGTTASIVFIMNCKYYTGHVGDSRIVLGRRHEASGEWMASSLTRDHKPESPREKRRIEAAGGQVMNKSGVDRVVWNRPKLGHKGPVRRSTSFDQIPFLAVARSLGDLWSYNSELNTYVVSPEPDVKCIPIDGNDTCLLLASDGLWNMMTTQTAVRVLQEVEEDQYGPELLEAMFGTGSARLSPSRALVHFCLNRWYQTRFRADNTTVLAVMIEDNQGIQLTRADQSLPMSAIFSDSEEDEDSDDGYYETMDSKDYFGQNYYSFKNLNNSVTNDNQTKTENRSDTSSDQISTLSTSLNTSVHSTTEKSPNTSTSSAELLAIKPMDDNNPIAEEPPVLTPLTNVSPNFESNSETNAIFDQNSNTFEPIDSPIDESSRDSGTVSPPTPLAITAAEELTDEEYYALPSVVNLSQNEWELFVVIDPKTLSVLSTDFNTVSISGEENSPFVEECQSSLANLNKVVEDNSTQLSNYFYRNGSVHRSGALLRQQTNATDFMVNYSDNYWPDCSSFYSLSSMRPRSSLPLSFVDNRQTPSQDSKDLKPEQNLSFFGALNSSSIANTDTSYLKKLSKVLSNGNKELTAEATSVTAEIKQKRSRVVLRHRSCHLLKRLETSLSPRLSLQRGLKRKHSYSPSDYSPPSKHLRSSLWTRPLVSKEQVMRMSFTRSLKQLAVGRLTRSRLRPLKLLKSGNNHKK